VNPQNIYTIPPSISFADTLAQQVMAEYSEVPEKLSEVLILLPNRRSLRTMQEAFLRQSGGKALLLPQLQAIGDIDARLVLRYAKLDDVLLAELQELPVPISETERLLLLTDLIWIFQRKGLEMKTGKHQAMRLAVELGRFLDELQREQIPWERFDALVPQEYAAQWQATAAFLGIIRQQWPLILKERGLCDPWQCRNQTIGLLAKAWRRQPPTAPIIAAGTTGSIPIVTELLKVIAALPQGRIILPGLNRKVTEDEMGYIDESHPQFMMLQLLEALDQKPGEVLVYGTGQEGGHRTDFLSVMMQPAELTDRWSETAIYSDMHDCHLLECATMQEEAAVIAYLFRETLETPGKTAALVTPNRALARRVQQWLARWDVTVDDSAGIPLSETPCAVFLRLVNAVWSSHFSPVSVLALLKHPVLRMGREPGEIRPLARQLELTALRGIQGQHWKLLTEKVSGPVGQLAEELWHAFEPLRELSVEEEDGLALDQLVEAHLEVAESLSYIEPGRHELWNRPESETLSVVIDRLLDAARQTGVVFLPSSYPQVIEQVLAQESYRQQYGTHGRLHILSPMESRLQHFDRVILSDMNEGGWPDFTGVDPWLNRPMRKALELPSPEQRIGLETHDFVQMAAGPEVFLTRSLKQQGAPTVPSRFLQRWEALLMLAGGERAVKAWKKPELVLAVRTIDTPDTVTAPVERPSPKPPVSARPRQLSVTRIERLMRDPYGIYAQKILRLSPLDPLEQELQAREFGNALHAALEDFMKQSGLQQPDPLAVLLRCGEKAFEPYRHIPVVHAIWLPRFEKIAQWLVATLPAGEISDAELDGKWHFDTPRGPFTITAKVDRIYRDEKGVHLVDYKTGGAPSLRELHSGVANQLLLAAVMAEQGAFGPDYAAPVASLSYWQLKGGRIGGEVKTVKPSPDNGGTLQGDIACAKEALPSLMARFDDVNFGYPAVPDVRMQPKYNDYAHLARIFEWAY
jgi:ATP-dependent helicase/nuclease subunit B